MPRPKSFKIVIPGEVIKKVEQFKTADGTVITWNKTSSIVVPSKKNQQRMVVNKKTLKVMPIESEQHEKWHAAHIKIFRKEALRLEQEGCRLPLMRCKINVVFFFPTSAKRDLSNKFETIADILTDSGIIYDDRFQVLNPVSLSGYCHRARPRTEIFLSILEPDNPQYEWDKTPKEYTENKKAIRTIKKRNSFLKRRENKRGNPIASIISSLINRSR